jgi:hypothetical protein
MSITLDGTNGITAPLFDGPLDAADLTGDVAAARITTALNAGGSAPIYACRAWVNFNGTGTPAIRASGNVSSVTKSTAGHYTLNFTTAMPDANYSAVAFTQWSGGPYVIGVNTSGGYATSSISIVTGTTAGGGTDIATLSLAVFR